MSTYRLEEAPELDAPVIVAALEGWVDAGSAGTTAAAQLADGGTLVATFDADAIYDYRARRPTLDIVDGRPMHLAWPQLELTATRIGARDLLVLRGPGARLPMARAHRRRHRGRQAPRRRLVGKPRRDSGGGAAHAAGADPGHRLGPRAPRRRNSAGAGRIAPRAVCLPLGAGGGGCGERHPGHRALRPGPALRQRDVSGGIDCPARRARPTPGYRAAGRPARDARARATQPARRGDRDRRGHQGRMSSGSRGWSTRRGSRRATS